MFTNNTNFNLEFDSLEDYFMNAWGVIVVHRVGVGNTWPR